MNHSESIGTCAMEGVRARTLIQHEDNMGTTRTHGQLGGRQTMFGVFLTIQVA